MCVGPSHLDFCATKIRKCIELTAIQAPITDITKGLSKLDPDVRDFFETRTVTLEIRAFLLSQVVGLWRRVWFGFVVGLVSAVLCWRALREKLLGVGRQVHD